MAHAQDCVVSDAIRAALYRRKPSALPASPVPTCIEPSYGVSEGRWDGTVILAQFYTPMPIIGLFLYHSFGVVCTYISI